MKARKTTLLGYEVGFMLVHYAKSLVSAKKYENEWSKGFNYARADERLRQLDLPESVYEEIEKFLWKYAV